LRWSRRYFHYVYTQAVALDPTIENRYSCGQQTSDHRQQTKYLRPAVCCLLFVVYSSALFCMIFRNGVNRSIGSGNRVVLLFSLATSVSVCRNLS
jgi:hypothetical protein